MAVPPCTLADFKTFLRVGDNTLDTELQPVLEAATDAIESACGPMVARAVTETVREVGCDGSFQLETWPVISVTTIADHFTAASVSLTGLDIDLTRGVISGAPWSRGYDVTVSAGRTTIPGPLVEATKIVGEQLWQTRRGPAAARFTQSGVANGDQVPVYKGYAWPNRAVQLIEPYRLLWVG